MTPMGWFIIIFCFIIGYFLAVFLFKKFPNLFQDNKKIDEVINNPHLLAKKLNANGKIFDDGNEVKIGVGIDKETGKEIVTVEEIKSKEAKTIQKKVEKSSSPTEKLALKLKIRRKKKK